MCNILPVSDALLTSRSPQAECDDAPPDPSVLRAQSQLADLETLRRLAMEIAVATSQRALAEGGDDGPAQEPRPDKPDTSSHRRPAAARDPVDAFARISRVVRLTIALERKTDDALRAIKAGIIAECETRRAKATARAKADAAAWAAGESARETRVRDLVEEAIGGRGRRRGDLPRSASGPGRTSRRRRGLFRLWRHAAGRHDPAPVRRSLPLPRLVPLDRRGLGPAAPARAPQILAVARAPAHADRTAAPGPAADGPLDRVSGAPPAPLDHVDVDPGSAQSPQ